MQTGVFLFFLNKGVKLFRQILINIFFENLLDVFGKRLLYFKEIIFQQERKKKFIKGWGFI